MYSVYYDSSPRHKAHLLFYIFHISNSKCGGLTVVLAVCIQNLLLSKNIYQAVSVYINNIFSLVALKFSVECWFDLALQGV